MREFSLEMMHLIMCGRDFAFKSWSLVYRGIHIMQDLAACSTPLFGGTLKELSLHVVKVVQMTGAR